MVLVHLVTGARELDIVANINKRIICASCEQLSLDPHLMSCGNVLCPKCLTSVSVGDNVCPCGTECGHPFSFRNFELQVLNLMVRCPDGCGSLVPMRCVDTHLRKCKLSDAALTRRCRPAYDVDDDVFKVVDNVADTVSVAIDLGYPLKFETPPSQIYQWTPETPPPPPAATTLHPSKHCISIPAKILTTLEASLGCRTETIEAANEAKRRAKPSPSPDQRADSKRYSTPQIATENNPAASVVVVVATSNAAEREDKSSDRGRSQSQSTTTTGQESDRNSPTEHVTSRSKSHHRKMKENDTLYMDEGVLKLLESGVSGRTRGVQKCEKDSEKDARKDGADARSGRASPTAAARRSSLSRSKEYSSMYNLKPFRIVIERIPDEIFQKHLSAQGFEKKQKPKESSQAMKNSFLGVSCTSKRIPALSSLSSPLLLQREANVKEGKHPDATGEIIAVKKTGNSVAETTPANIRQQQPTPKILSSKAKPIPSSAESAAAANAKQQGQTHLSDAVSNAAAGVKSEAATSTASSSSLDDELKERKQVAQDQRNVGTATAKGNHAQAAPPPPPSPQTSVMRPAAALQSSMPSLNGENVKTLPNKNIAGKIVDSHLFEGGLKSVISRKMKRVARSSDNISKTPVVKKPPPHAPGPQSGSAGKLVAAVPSNLQTGARKIMTAKTSSFGARKDGTLSPMSFKIPRKSTVSVGIGGGMPDSSGGGGPSGSAPLERRVSEDPRSTTTTLDQKNSPSNKRAFLSTQYASSSPPVEVERKRGRIEERRLSANMPSHQGGRSELCQSSGSMRSDKIFHPCLENSFKQTERVMSVSTENEPASESDPLSAMSLPVRIPLEPQVAVKESIPPQASFHRLIERRPVLELGLFSERIWSAQVPSDNSSRHSGNERSSLSPPPPQPPPPPLMAAAAAFTSSPSMSSSSLLLSSSALLARKQPFDVRCQQFTEPSQLSNSMQQNNPSWRDFGSTTSMKADPRRGGCSDPRSGAAAAAVVVGVQKSAPPFPPQPPPPAGYGTIIYQRGMRVYQIL